jgi:hypothetical protein
MKTTIPSAEYLLFIDDAILFLLDSASSLKSYNQGNDEGIVTENLLFTSRWSFISTCLAVEAAANKALQAVPVSRRSYDAFERLGPLEKHEMYALYRGKENFRSSNYVAETHEIISARNRYVHPKSKAIPLTPIEEELGVETSPSPKLCLPSHFSMIYHEHALAALDAVLRFEAWFFIDYCELTQAQTIKLLLDLEDHNSGNLVIAHEMFGLDFRTVSRRYPNKAGAH